MLPDETDFGRALADRWLHEAVQRLRAALKPELILLFGSRARGTESRRSDVDLLVVWNTDAPPLERIGQVLGLLADSPWPVDVIAYTPADLQARRHSPFLRRALEEGKILYERRAA
ncbi:nucleotidyltransferase domain-containing protein [Methylolobus aquaticus]|nr:nucleotidyltransferase domain-containing protein [Methylolobus aquaticus]